VSITQIISDSHYDLGDVEDRMDAVEAKMEVDGSVVQKLRGDLDKALAMLSEISWVMERSCNGCDKSSTVRMRIQDLQRSIYLEDGNEREV